jgi:hypothetical protein
MERGFIAKEGGKKAYTPTSKVPARFAHRKRKL